MKNKLTHTFFAVASLYLFQSGDAVSKPLFDTKFPHIDEVCMPGKVDGVRRRVKDSFKKMNSFDGPSFSSSLKKAENDLKRVIYCEPDDMDSIATLAKTYLLQGEHKDAEDIANFLEMRNGENAFIYSMRGQIRLEKGRYDEAISEFTKAIRLEPENHNFYYLLGISHFKQKNFNAAEKTCKRGILMATHGKTDARRYDLLIALGSIYSELRRYDDSVKALNEAVGVDDNRPDAYHDLGILSIMRGNVGEGIDLLDLAAKKSNGAKFFKDRAEFFKNEYGIDDKPIISPTYRLNFNIQL